MRRGLLVSVAVIVVLGVLLLGIGFFSTRNRLVGLDEQVNSSWSQVANQYQRRMDLIPNLVETVKGVAEFERETFTQVAEARAKAGQTVIRPGEVPSPQQFQQFEQTQGQLTSALSRLLVTVEKYPDLKANASSRPRRRPLSRSACSPSRSSRASRSGSRSSRASRGSRSRT